MKTAVELEKELKLISRQLCEISMEINSSSLHLYLENKLFMQLTHGYKVLFEDMYIQAKKESYYWLFSSFEVYEKLFDQRKQEYLLRKENFLDFLVEEYMRTEYIETMYFPLIIDYSDFGKLSMYASNYSASFFDDWVLKRIVVEENNKKCKYLERWSKQLERKSEEERLNFNSYLDEKFNVRKKIDDVSCRCDKEGQVVDLNVVENNIRIAREFILVFSGSNFIGVKIMEPTAFSTLEKEVSELIKNERIPSNIVTIAKINISNQFIIKLFWYINKEVKTYSGFKEKIIKYIKIKFLQLGTIEEGTIVKKFSSYGRDFERDFNYIMKKIGENNGDIVVRLLTIKSP